MLQYIDKFSSLNILYMNHTIMNTVIQYHITHSKGFKHSSDIYVKHK